MTVAEKGSFTLAAKALGITQPAVSQNIAELERNVGVELFARKRGSVSLTAAGLAFKEYASKILYWYSAAESMFGGEGLTGASSFSISADDFVSGHVLPSVISELRLSGLNISFNVSNETESKEGESDFRIACRPHPSNPSLADSARIAGTVPIVAITAPTSVQQMKAASLWELPSDTEFVAWKPLVSLLPVDIRPRIVLETDSISLVNSYVLSAPGSVGLLPLEAASENATRLSIPLSSLAMDLCITSSEKYSGSQLLLALRSIIGRHFSI